MRNPVNATVASNANDGPLTAWLQQNGTELPDTQSMAIGIRAWDGRIYRRITVHGLAEFLRCTRFLEDECQLVNEGSSSRTGADGLDQVFSHPPQSEQPAAHASAITH